MIGPSPRTARRIASELAELLTRSGMTGPVVPIGASIAGLDVRVFASDYPDRAAGLVLVDRSHEDQAHEVPQMARFIPLLSTIGVLRLLGVSLGQRIESLAPQCGTLRGQPVFAQPGLRRRLTRSSTFGKARRKSGARAASSRSCARRHWWTGSRRELATAAARSSGAVGTRMSDRRRTVRSRRGGRPARGRRGRDPDCRRDRQSRDVPLCDTPAANAGGGPRPQ